MTRRRPTVATIIGIVLACATTLGAQDSTKSKPAHSAIIGRVTDQQHAAVAGVEVMLRELPASATKTNDSGRFVISNVVEGAYHLVLRRVGYEPRSFVANIAADDTLIVENIQIVSNGQATQLPTVEVRDRAAESRDLAAFEQRRKTGVGKFITPAEMAKVSGSPLSNVLGSRAPELARVRFPPCAGTGLAIGGSAASSIQVDTPKFSPRCNLPAFCYASVWIDGVRIYSPGTGAIPPNIDQFQTNEIEAIEIYPRGGQTPTEYNLTGSGCGTILIWRKR